MAGAAAFVLVKSFCFCKNTVKRGYYSEVILASTSSFVVMPDCSYD